MAMKYAVHLKMQGAQNARYAKTIPPADMGMNKTHTRQIRGRNCMDISEVLIIC